MSRAAHHFTFARVHAIEPSNCDGFVRRLYVRPGNREVRTTARIGWICDGCGETWLDHGWREVVQLARRGELRSVPPAGEVARRA